MSEHKIAKMGENFDVYISYRKSDGSEVARLINLAFKNAGYRCFLNQNHYHKEEFDIELATVLFDAPIFVMVLTKKYFAQCNEEGDFIRQEIETALANKKIIIPINYDSVLDGVPDYLNEELKNAINALEFITVERGRRFSASFNQMLNQQINNIEGVLHNQKNKAIVTLVSDADCVLLKNNKVIATLQADQESCIFFAILTDKSGYSTDLTFNK